MAGIKIARRNISNFRYVDDTTLMAESEEELIEPLVEGPAAIWEPPKIKSVTVSTIFPSIGHDVMGPDAIILVFQMLIFKPIFTLLFHFHQKAF